MGELFNSGGASLASFRRRMNGFGILLDHNRRHAIGMLMNDLGSLARAYNFTLKEVWKFVVTPR
jgi:hypothetical protein